LMVIGFIALFLGLIAPAFGFFFFLPVWLILSYVIILINFFAGLPLAAVNL